MIRHSIRIIIVLAMGAGSAGGANAEEFANIVGITEPEDVVAIYNLQALETVPERAVERYQALIEGALKEENREIVIESKIEPHLYWGLRDYAVERMMRMPDGYSTYQKKYGALAEADLAPAKEKGSIERLLQISARYPLTLASKEAMEALGEIYFQRAQFKPALAWWERVIRTFPKDRPLSSLNMARAAYVCMAASRPAHLEALIRLAQQAYPDESLVVGGRKVRLVDYMSGLKKERLNGKKALEEFRDWTSPRGNLANAKGIGSDVEADSRRWLFGRLHDPIDVPDPVYRDDSHKTSLAGQNVPITSESFDPTSPHLPVVENGTIYVNLGRAVYAIPIDGEGYPLWQAPASPNNYRIPLLDHEDVEYSCTLDEGRIYASLLLPDEDNDTMIRQSWPGRGRDEYPSLSRAPNRLACIDAKTGAFIWKTDRSFASFGYVSTPIRSGDKIYALAVERVQPKTSVYLVAVAAETGTLLCKTFISSLKETPESMRMRAAKLMGNPAPIPSPLAESSGRLYFTTNVGSIVCAEAATGDIVWLRRYHQDRLYRSRTLEPKGNEQTPRWFNNAPVIHDGVVYVTPTDSSRLMALDAGTGRLLNEMSFSAPRYILSVGDDQLFVAGEATLRSGPESRTASLTGFLLRNPDVPKVYVGEGADADKIIKQTWSQQIPDLCGLPAIGDERIYVPTRAELVALDAHTGAPLPWKLRWSTLTTDEDVRRNRPSGPPTAGNILVIGDVIISSSQYEISVLHNLKQRVAGIRALGQGPGKDIDVSRRIGIAELAAGKMEEARKQFETAMEALNQYGGPGWQVYDGSWPTSVKGQLFYIPRTIGIQDDVTIRLMGTSFDMAMARIDSGRFGEAKSLLDSITAARIDGHERLAELRFDGSSPNTPRPDVTPAQFRYAMLTAMAKGGACYLQMRQAEAALAKGDNQGALREYDAARALWASHSAFDRLPPFTYSPSSGTGLITTPQMYARLLAGTLLANTHEGLRMWEDGKKDEAITWLKKGMIEDSYPIEGSPPMTSFQIPGVAETGVGAVAAHARELLRQFYLKRFENAKDTAAAAAELAEADRLAPSQAEKISLLISKAAIYERLGMWAEARGTLGELAEKYGEVKYPFEAGKEPTPVADYVKQRLGTLPGPRP